MERRWAYYRVEGRKVIFEEQADTDRFREHKLRIESSMRRTAQFVDELNARRTSETDAMISKMRAAMNG